MLFKKKRQRANVFVKCDVCNQTDNIHWKQIQVEPVGYKGKLRYYTICTKCNKRIIISENNVPKKTLNHVKFRYYF